MTDLPAPDAGTPGDSPEGEGVAELRAHVAKLEAELNQREAPAGGAPGPGRQRWRTVLVFLMVTLVAVLAPLSVVANWAHDEIGDTDRYVDTVTPLGSDPAVQNAIANRISQEIFSYIDVNDVTQKALTAISSQKFVPPRVAALLPSLSVPLTSAIENFVRTKVNAVVHSEAFEQAWVEANRQAHAQMVAVLTGKTNGSVSVTDGAVKVNLASFIEAAKQQLIQNGFSFANKIPEVNATFTVFEAKNLGAAQKWFSWLSTLATVLPILVLVLLAGALLLARSRRKTLLAAGLSVAVSMVLLGLGLNIVRPIYLNAIPSDVIPPDAAAAIYDALVHFIRTALRAVGIVALAIALAAFWFAPTGAGAAMRAGSGRALSRVRNRATGAGMNVGPVGGFLATYRTFVPVVIVGLGALWYLSLDHPTGKSAVIIIVLVVVVLVVVEFLTPAAPAAEQPEA